MFLDKKTFSFLFSGSSHQLGRSQSRAKMSDTVAVVAEGGDQFAKMFYSSLDTSRQDLKHLYHDESKVVWNGQPLLGREKVSAFLSELPPSRHDLSSLDCQPVAVPGIIIIMR
jgi:hypothetical protein